MTVRVILAEDHQMFRQALGQVLVQNGITLVGEAGDGREAVELVQELEPGIVVMDISMPRLNGIEATIQIRAATPHTRVIVLSRFAEQNQVVRALKAGADGYLLKNDAINELLIAINAVNRGDLYISPAVLRPVVEGYLAWVEQQGESPIDRLTDREREVLQLVAEGKSNQAIAQELNLGVRTVETHRANLMSKLDLHNVADVVRFAFQHGILGPTD
jgi:DNA-binding NarL/FixJ family response regulator